MHKLSQIRTYLTNRKVKHELIVDILVNEKKLSKRWGGWKGGSFGVVSERREGEKENQSGDFVGLN